MTETDSNPASCAHPNSCHQVSATACTFFEMLYLTEAVSVWGATEKGVAMLIDPVAEEPTIHADHTSFPTLQIPLSNESPFLYEPLVTVQLYRRRHCDCGKE
tara:strand:- start:48 stop:353 length:306 start_codon:yes stop_codon:yes gene_type:complete